MQNGTFEKLADDVEVDETYIGGKARNMHKHVRAEKITGTGGKDKAVVMGMLERGGPVKVQHVDRPKKKTLQGINQENTIPGCRIFSDALKSYEGLGETYQHYVIDHATAYVDGIVHTNGLENFWSLLKRTLSGTYVSVEPFHLHRYLDEQAFRFNERMGTDCQRFTMAVSNVLGKRATLQDASREIMKEKRKSKPKVVPVVDLPKSVEFQQFAAFTRELLKVPKTEIDRRVEEERVKRSNQSG